MGFIVAYVTHSSREEAEKIVNALLEKRIIACANFLPIESVYWWKGRVEKNEEMATLLKTRTENWEKLQAEIRTLHSYETPCIMKFEVDANPEYEAWVHSETK